MIVDFSSDTTAGVSQEIMNAIIKANKGCMAGYFNDEYTEKVRKQVQKMFTKPVETYFVSNGTAVNILGLKMLTNGVCSIMCTNTTHISNSEMGAVEYSLRTKIITCEHKNGKITVEKIKKEMSLLGHKPPIKVIAISQVTEMGNCYTIKELKKLCDFAHANNMYVYMDGARIANALAFLKCSLKELVEDTGVDAFSIGGNKNGCMFGELLIFMNTELAQDLTNEQKQMSLTFSKTRFFGCQFEEYFKNDLWLKNATHSNNMAIKLCEKLKKLGYINAYPVESNAVFIKLSHDTLSRLKLKYKLKYWDKANKVVRIMTNFSTTDKQIDNLVKDILEADNKR